MATQKSPNAQPETAQPESLDALCHREVVELHQFFEDWFLAKLDDTDAAFDRFSSAMADSFQIVPPSGFMSDIDRLNVRLRSAHGAWTGPDGNGTGWIWVSAVNTRPVAGHDDLCLVTYEEWQEREGVARGRQSTALMQRDESAPGGVLWLHVHETWLPPDRPAEARPGS